MRIGEKVRILREAQGLTLQDLARMIGVHQVTLSQYERGTRPLPYDDIEKFADALGADVALFAADEPWARIEEARRRYDAVIAEVQAVLKSARDTDDDSASESKPGAAHSDESSPTGADDFRSQATKILALR